MAATKSFEEFKQTIQSQFLEHPVVTDNRYTQWFSTGEISLDQLCHFAVQFSVFSNQFWQRNNFSVISGSVVGQDPPLLALGCRKQWPVSRSL